MAKIARSAVRNDADVSGARRCQACVPQMPSFRKSSVKSVPCGIRRLFLRGRYKRFSSRHIVIGTTLEPLSAATSSQSSASVRSGCAATAARIFDSSFFKLRSRPLACGKAPQLPVLRHLRQSFSTNEKVCLLYDYRDLRASWADCLPGSKRAWNIEYGSYCSSNKSNTLLRPVLLNQAADWNEKASLFRDKGILELWLAHYPRGYLLLGS